MGITAATVAIIDGDNNISGNNSYNYIRNIGNISGGDNNHYIRIKNGNNNSSIIIH